MKQSGIISALALTAAFTLSAGAASPQLECSARGMDIDVTFYTPSVVRVLKHPKSVTSLPESLVVIKTPEQVNVKTAKSGNLMMAQSDVVKVTVNTNTGAVEFASPDGT
ncbi:MAG: DUF4968 domain-containing protein, partial [Muribaculaceae bacterium]|nr:DUF4968 domain-containing protein [Muribaculaceae bacterium]